MHTNHVAARTHWQVTRSVWMALFLRESLGRVTAAPFAWFWMLLEPLMHVTLLIMVRELLGRLRIVTNAEFVPWILVGITTFLLFREGLTRSIGAIDANKGLFSYRQIKPIDPVLVRSVLEGLLKSLIFIIIISGASLLGYDILPFDPLGAMFVWLSVWLLGTSLGLLVSVVAALVKEIGRVVKMLMFPLYFLSGVIFPLQALPHNIQQYVLYNPIAHGVESIRLRFFEGYHTIDGISLYYLYYWIFATAALGLALHVKFASRVRAL
jgi:capsular polysaccharide transport system permease protein